MNKLVNWGHWVVAAFFTVSGAPFLFSVVTSLPGAYREHPQEGAYIFFWGMILSFPPLACAWGLFKWRRWGRTLGIVLSVLLLAAFAMMAFNGKVSAAESVFALIYCATFAWLLLPVVRAVYFRRDQIA